VKSYVSYEDTMNVIDVQIKPATQISTSHQLIIEFPTVGLNGYSLFNEDLGTGLASYDLIPFDFIEYTTITSSNCRNVIVSDLSLGSRYVSTLFTGPRNLPELQYKYWYGNKYTSFHYRLDLRFAFEIKNPVLPANDQRFIPITIYSLDTLRKTNFNVLKNVMFVQDAALYMAIGTPAASFSPSTIAYTSTA
jgi:hypothetical protein